MKAARHGLRPNAVAAIIALGMASGAAFALGVADALWHGTPTTGGSALTLLYLTGWVLVSWAAIIGAVVAVNVVRAAVARRRPSSAEIVLLAITIALLGAMALARPLVGSSGGSAATESTATWVGAPPWGSMPVIG